MSKKESKPYIGVTGITTIEQAKSLARTFKVVGLTDEEQDHVGMMGILVSPRSLVPGSSQRIKYPSLNQMRRIFEATEGASFNTLHFYSHEDANLAQQLKQLLETNSLYQDKLCTGVQLNMAWPSVSEIDKIKQNFPDLKMILQLGPKVLRENDPQVIVERLHPYRDLIDFSLIDPSGGRRRIFEVNVISGVHNLIHEAYPDLAIAFAGGFDGKNAPARLWVMYQTIGTTNFSIDAEGGLRIHRRDRMEPTPISVHRADRYLREAALFFSKHPTRGSKT